MSEALTAIDARLATLRDERAMLEYCDSFEEWGRRSRQIDAEVETLEGQRTALIQQRQHFDGREARLGTPMLAKAPPSA